MIDSLIDDVPQHKNYVIQLSTELNPLPIQVSLNKLFILVSNSARVFTLV